MAIIYNYPLNSILLAEDMLIGTSTKIVNGQPKNATKNFSIADLTGFIKQNVSLDDVLQVGNTSLLDAKVGSLYLYDTPVTNYGNIALNQNRFSFNTVTHGEVLRAQKDMLISFSSSGYRGSFEVSNITANRVWDFPDKSGTLALTSDIPSYTTPTLDQVLTEGNTSSTEIVIGTDFDNSLTLNQAYSNLKETSPSYVKQTGFTSENFYTAFDNLLNGKSYAASLSGIAGLYLQTFGSSGYVQLRSDLVTTTPRTIQFPDADGTLALTSDITAPSLAEVLLQGGRELVLYSETDTHILENADKSRLLYCRKNTEDYVAIQFGIQGGVFEAGDTIEFISSNIDIFELNVDVDLSGVILIYQGEEYPGGNVLQFEDKGIKLILTCIDTNTFELNIIPSYDAIFDRSAIIISSSFTAVNSRYYTTYGGTPITVTDPTAETCKGYIVYVVSGTTTIGGVGYTAGDLVYRYYNGSSWISTNMNAANGVTSVGLTMPSAFSVTNSPITSSGDITVTGAGTASQYVRGDGQLATFPSGGGGGSSVNYYLNGSIAASVATYKQMSNTAIIGAGTDFTKTGNGLIAQFLTDIGNPNRLEIPGGAWNFEMFFSMSSSGGTPKFYVELLKYDGAVFTSIASNSAIPETISGGTTIDLYLTSLAVPTTPLLVTDRLAIRIYIVDSTGGRTATLHTEDSHLCEIITTFSGGVTSLNGLTANTQYLAVGTSGTDFTINSLLDTHTFNLPTASATNRGALSTTDWTTFNNKQNALGFTPVPNTRELTINGTTFDLTANRSWTITASGKSINVVSVNTNAGSASSTDYVYLASGTINITLPTAVGNQNLYTIKNVGTGVITVDTTSSQTIDGSLTAPIRVQYLSLTLVSDGANWNII